MPMCATRASTTTTRAASAAAAQQQRCDDENVTSAPTTPLYAREAEYEAVVAFVHARLTQQHCRALFVFGACGCGKTTTVLRVLRALSQRPLSIDHTARRPRLVTVRGNSNTASVCVGCKRGREDNHHHDDGDSAGAARSNSDKTATSVARYSAAYFAQHYPALFAHSAVADATRCTRSSSSSSGDSSSRRSSSAATRRVTAATTTRGKTGAAAGGVQHEVVCRPVQGHFVNCADCTAPQLIEAVCRSLRTTSVRPDMATRALADAVAQLARPVTNSNNSSSNSSASSDAGSHVCASAAVLARTPLHIVVLDEVEYARTSARAALAQLATLSLTHATQLALVYISNQRELVHHVSAALLQELPFAAYDVTTLRRLAQDMVEQRLRALPLLQQQQQQQPPPPPPCEGAQQSSCGRRSRRDGKAAVAVAQPTVCVSASLYEYMARKALLHYAGDVRQLAAMCERVVETAACGTSATQKSNGHSSTAACMQAVEQHTRGTMTTTATKTMMTAATHEHDRGTTQPQRHGMADVTVLHTDGSATPAVTTATTSVPTSPYKDDSNSDSSRRSSVALPLTPRSSTSSNSSGRSSVAAAAAFAHDVTPRAAAMTAPPPPHVVTLGACIDVLKGNAVEEQLHQHVSTMPEQVLYVLCCLIVLTLRQAQVRERAVYFAVGDAAAPSLRGSRHSTGSLCSNTSRGRHSTSGRSSSSSSGGVGAAHGNGSNSAATLKVREVHQLYMALMGERHFPSMHAGGVALAIDSLADLGILTRPQRHGNDELFCLNGVWSVEAMQEVLTQRGEALRREAAACGLDGSENKFVCVLRDLKRLAQVDT